MALSKEELLAKAKAKLQQQKSTTADDPVLVPGTYPPELKTPEIKYQDTKGNPMGVLTKGTEAKFWCSHKSLTVHAPNGEKIEFIDHKVTLNRTQLIAHMRQLVRLYPARFKEM